MAMVTIHAEIEKRGLRSRMILQVHDELVFDCHRDETDEMTALVREKMETAVTLEVPLEVETGLGDNWLAAH
jgi:DNA polymerase-1